MYVLHLSPSVPLAGDIPSLVKEKIIIQELKVLACKEFVHIPSNEISNLDNNTK
jgi:hypothetical protein